MHQIQTLPPIPSTEVQELGQGILALAWSIPENRTEDEHLGLLYWLGATAQTESHRIGTRTDENGVEHEVWSHGMRPFFFPGSGQFVLRDEFRDEPMAWVDARIARHRREERARKRRKRQRRAAQRRHNRGMR